MRRKHVNKHRSASEFRNNAKRTKAINLAPRPTRGGGRL